MTHRFTAVLAKTVPTQTTLHSLLGALAICAASAVLVLAPGPAKADCQFTGLGVVTCTGVDADGFGTGVESLLAVNVDPGAVVIGPGISGLNLLDANAVSNLGTIDATLAGIAVGAGNIVTNGDTGIIFAGGNGIFAGGNNDVLNTGTINAGILTPGTFGIAAGSNNVADFNLDGDFGIVNRGAINAASGIGVIDGNIVVNAGTLDVTVTGIAAGANNAITNDGTITSGGDGINATTGNVVKNTSDDSIIAGGDGIAVTDNNDVTNTGTITAEAGIGISAGSGNASDLDLVPDGDAGIVNRGTINALTGIDAVDSNVVVNIGDINATGTGIAAGANNAVTNEGSIDSGGDGINATTLNLIKNISDDTIIAGGDGIEVGDDNDVTNVGAITADGFGILAGSNNFQDFDLDGDAGLVNRGTINAQSGIGALDGNIIVNAGAIDAAETGVLAGSVNAIENAGSIVAGTDGIGALSGNIVTNTADGTIEAGTGIRVADNNDVLNAGLLTVSGIGVVVDNDNALDFDEDGFAGVTNTGTITAGTGILAGSGNIITNTMDGVIDATTDGVVLTGDNNVLTNEGDILSANGSGVVSAGDGDLDGSGNVINNVAGATITGAAGPAVTTTGMGTTTINNTGLLQGAPDGDGAPTIAILGGDGDDIVNNTDGGVIIGDVRLGGGSDSFFIDDASTIDGLIDLGESEGDQDILAVGGPSDMTFDQDIDGVELLNKVGTGTVTLNGTTTVANGPDFTVPVGIDTNADGIVDETVQVFFAPLGTTVFAGRLDVGGLDAEGQPITEARLISPEVDVLPGSTLGGHGTIVTDPSNFGSVFVSGLEADPLNPTGLQGSIAPGTSIGTLTVEGTVIFADRETAVVDGGEIVTNNGGRFEADLNDAGGHDLLNVLATGAPETALVDLPVDTTGPDGMPDGVPDGLAPVALPTNDGRVLLGGTFDIVLDGEFVADNPDTPDVDESRDADGTLIPRADYGAAAQVYDVIIAENGIEGTFDEISFDGGPNDGALVIREDDPDTPDIDETVRVQVFKGHLDYLTDRVRVTSIPTFERAASTLNQTAVSIALDDAVPYGLSQTPFTSAMAQLGLSGDVPGGLDDLHGEWYNAFTEVGIDMARGAIDQAHIRAAQVRGGTAPANATAISLDKGTTAGSGGGDVQSTLWTAASYSFTDVDGRDGFIGYDFDTVNGYVGLDFNFNDSILVGIMTGYGHSTVDVDNRTGEGDVDSWQIAGYASYYGPQWYATITGGFRNLSIDSVRDITFGTVDLAAVADYSGEVFYVAGQVGYAFDLGNSGWQATPEIGLTYVSVDQDAFVETGAAPLNLSIDEQSHDSLRIRGQVRVSRPMKMGNGRVLLPYVRLGIAHELEDDLRPIVGRIDGTTEDFIVFGDPASRTSALFGAGLSGQISDGITLFLDYAGELGGSLSDHTISGGARVLF